MAVEGDVQDQGEDLDDTNSIGKTERPFVREDDNYKSRINTEG